VFLWLVVTSSSKVLTVWWVPAWILALTPFWYSGWITGSQAGVPWDAMLSELQNFLLLPLLLIIATTVLENRAEWNATAYALYATAAFVAFMGLLEYFYPDVRNILPQFVSDATPYVSQDGFARAAFSFWGHQAAAFICALAVPFVIPLLQHKRNALHTLLIWSGAALMLGAVYLSGFRILWLLTAVQVLLWLMLQRRFAAMLIVASATVSGYASLPETTRLRAESFVLALQGNPVDTSSASHLTRLSGAVDVVSTQPFGLGWTGSGWVHCDFVQIAANLGIIPGFIFAGAFLWTAFGITRLALKRGPNQPLNAALLLSFVTAGGILATQVISVLPQLACPIWLTWALTAVAIRQQTHSKEALNHARATFRPTSNFQLRTYDPRHAGVGAQRY
jgi:hypothetical protein